MFEKVNVSQIQRITLSVLQIDNRRGAKHYE